MRFLEMCKLKRGATLVIHSVLRFVLEVQRRATEGRPGLCLTLS